MMTLAVGFTLIALVALLVGEAVGAAFAVWIAKPLASAGFIAVGITAGAPSSTFGQLVLVALVLSWWGDVLLIRRAPSTFLAGLVSFLLAHLAYTAAFLARGAAPGWLVVAVAALIVPGVVVMRWLRPHVGGAMWLPVCGYVAVISVMVACAVATAARAGGALIPLGAMMFYVSDLAVARNHFVSPGFANKLWGLPLYYSGQLLLATSASTL